MAVNTHVHIGNIKLDKIENATEKEQRNSGTELVYNAIHESLAFTVDLRIDRASDLNWQMESVHVTLNETWDRCQIR